MTNPIPEKRVSLSGNGPGGGAEGAPGWVRTDREIRVAISPSRIEEPEGLGSSLMTLVSDTQGARKPASPRWDPKPAG